MQKSHFHLIYSSSAVTKAALFLTLSLCILLTGIAVGHAGEKVQSKVQIPHTPQRIVVFPLFAEEMLLEMTGPSRIVYVGHDYWENGEAYSPTMELTKHIQGNYWQYTLYEDILDLKPDLVVLWKESASICMEDFPELETANIPVLFLHTPETIEDIMNTLLILGEAVGAKDRAAQMVKDMEATLAQISQIVSSIPQEKRVRATYYEDDAVFEDGEPCCFRSNNFSLIARAAGVQLASGNDEDYKIMSRERIAQWNPDLLTVVPVSYDTDGSIYDISYEYIEGRITSLLDDPQLSFVTAIKNRNVHPLSLHESQFIVQSVMDLARLAYPDLFPVNAQ